MYPLFESIRIGNGSVMNLPFHKERMARSCREVLGLSSPPSIQEVLKGIVLPQTGVYKLRLAYGETTGPVSVEAYVPRAVTSLRLVTCDDIEYSHKYSDREIFTRLLAEKEKCDDILVVRHGRITDTSYSNIAFYDGEKYITPASPLLDGTMRRSLIARGILVEDDITVNDLRLFVSATLINAMLDHGRTVISTDHII